MEAVTGSQSITTFSFPWPVKFAWPVESAAACEVRSYFTGLFQQAYFTGRGP